LNPSQGAEAKPVDAKVTERCDRIVYGTTHKEATQALGVHA
jgi:hypothetical protein